MYDDALRHRLVACAATTIAAGGIEAVSLRQVARDAGTSTNAVYTLFGGRDGLVTAALESAIASFFDAQTALVETDDVLADLHRLGDAYRAWALAEPAFYQVMFGGRLAMGFTDFPSLADTLGPITTVTRRALDEGLFAGLEPHEAATLLWSTVHGFVSLEITQWGDIPRAERDALYRALQTSFIQGSLVPYERAAAARSPEPGNDERRTTNGPGLPRGRPGPCRSGGLDQLW